MQEIYGKAYFPRGPNTEFYFLKRYAEELAYRCVVADKDPAQATHVWPEHPLPTLLDDEPNPLEVVYRLTHVLPCNHSDKEIGYFSSLEKAIAARDIVAQYEGFRDFVAHFLIEKYEINQPYWQHGYITKKVTYLD